MDEIVGYVFSLSYCSPTRFDDADAFETELRDLLIDRDEDVFQQEATVDVIAGTV